MRKIHGNVVVHRKAPDGTGWVRDLYKIDGVPAEVAQHMERVFLHMVDTEAADALHRLKRPSRGAWPIRERDGWIRFILSLIFRNPESINIIKLHLRAVWDESLASLRHDYEQKRLPEDPETFEEFSARVNPNAAAIAASNFMQTIMNSEVVGNAIANMTWSRLHLVHSKYSLLTSDRPIDMPIVLQSKDAYITLPIGPKIVFVASNDGSALRNMRDKDHSAIVRKINQRLVAQARQYVWGVDDSALAFVKKHIRTLPDREIMSEKARRKSLEDARGNTAAAGAFWRRLATDEANDGGAVLPVLTVLPESSKLRGPLLVRPAH
jgi:hypothetical protein